MSFDIILPFLRPIAHLIQDAAVAEVMVNASGRVFVERRGVIEEVHGVTVDVAARLGVSRFTVRSWRFKGVGPRFMKMGRAVRYRPQDVDEYERQALVETRAQSDRMPM